jgi:hypothetical protein
MHATEPAISGWSASHGASMCVRLPQLLPSVPVLPGSGPGRDVLDVGKVRELMLKACLFLSKDRRTGPVIKESSSSHGQNNKAESTLRVGCQSVLQWQRQHWQRRRAVASSRPVLSTTTGSRVLNHVYAGQRHKLQCKLKLTRKLASKSLQVAFKLPIPGPTSRSPAH